MATFQYNTDRELTKVADAAGGSWQYDYDLAHTVTKIADPEGSEYSYLYDALGAITKETDPLGNATTFDYQTDYTQSNAELLTKAAVSGLAAAKGEVRLAYDDMRRLTSVAAGDASWLGRYEYDVNGFITKLDEGTLCATDSTFAYDADTNALTRGVLGYMVDASSRLSKHALSYDRLGRATDHTFGSDDAGNRRRMRWQYAYDDSNAGRLRAMASSNHDGLSAGSTTTATYDYNPSGDRVKRVEGAVTKLWSYDGHNIATAESSDNANVYSVYALLGGEISNAVARHDVNASSNSTANL